MAWIGTSACGSPEEAPEETPPAPTTDIDVGVQLFTVRSLMEDGFEETLQQVADIGYTETEFAGYYGRDAATVKALLDNLGLAAPAAHIRIEELRSNLDEVIAMTQGVGHRYVVCPWLAEDQRSIEHYREHARLFNEVGAACSEAGLEFAYHNHDFEFFETDGVLPYDLLLAETDPALVKMELDLYWIAKAGHSALDYFDRHPGRFPLWHIKDMAEDGNITVVGSGTINFASIFAARDTAGLVHYFVEHDNPEDPLDSITRGLAHVHTVV